MAATDHKTSKRHKTNCSSETDSAPDFGPVSWGFQSSPNLLVPVAVCVQRPASLRIKSSFGAVAGRALIHFLGQIVTFDLVVFLKCWVLS